MPKLWSDNMPPYHLVCWHNKFDQNSSIQLATLRVKLYCWSRRLVIRSVSIIWKGYFASSVLTPATVSSLMHQSGFWDTNYLAYFQHGILLVFVSSFTLWKTSVYLLLFPVLLHCLLFPHPLLLVTSHSPFFLKSVLSLHLSSNTPHVVLSTEHCSVPC